jgi:hypothetical protein
LRNVLNPCGSWLASDGGLTADRYLRNVLNPCGSWLASDVGLTADRYLRDVLNPCGSWLASDGGLRADRFFLEYTQSNCGSELAREDGMSGNAHSNPPTR